MLGLSTQPWSLYWEERFDFFEDRATRRLTEKFTAIKVPEGWPITLQGPLTWGSGSFQDDRENIYARSPSEIDEIKAALSSFNSTCSMICLKTAPKFQYDQSRALR